MKKSTGANNFLSRFSRPGFLENLNLFINAGKQTSLLMLVLIAMVIIMLSTALYTYPEVLSTSSNLTMNAMRLTIVQNSNHIKQVLQTSARFASTFYGLTAENSERNEKILRALIHQQNTGVNYDKIQKRIEEIKQSGRNAYVSDIDFSKTLIQESVSKTGQAMFSILMPITLQEEVNQKIRREQRTISMLVVLQEETLVNPYGLSVWSISEAPTQK